MLGCRQPVVWTSVDSRPGTLKTEKLQMDIFSQGFPLVLNRAPAVYLTGPRFINAEPSLYSCKKILGSYIGKWNCSVGKIMTATLGQLKWNKVCVFILCIVYTEDKCDQGVKWS